MCAPDKKCRLLWGVALQYQMGTGLLLSRLEDGGFGNTPHMSPNKRRFYSPLFTVKWIPVFFRWWILVTVPSVIIIAGVRRHVTLATLSHPIVIHAPSTVFRPAHSVGRAVLWGREGSPSPRHRPIVRRSTRTGTVVQFMSLTNP